MEALVALTLTMVLVGLVSSVFLAQTDFYGNVVRRSEVHDVTWTVGNLVANDVRSVLPGGVLVAAADQLVAHVPLSMGVTCAISGNHAWAYYPRGGDGLDTDVLTGFSVRDGSDGTWRFHDATWADMYDDIGRDGKEACADIGMDTVGIPDSLFVRLNQAGNNLPYPPEIGGASALHRELELRIADSELDPGRLGLFRGTHGATLVEFASGMGPGTSFSYRLDGETDFQSSVSGADLPSIHEVRITVEGVSGDRGGGLDAYEYTLSRDIVLAKDD